MGIACVRLGAIPESEPEWRWRIPRRGAGSINRQATFSSQLSESEKNFIRVSFFNSAAIISEIRYRQIPATEIDQLIDNMQRQEFKANTTIFVEGEKQSDVLYVVKEGRCDLRQGREVTKVACEGEVIGAVDFLNELPRISTAHVTGDKLVVYALRKEDFRSIVDKPVQSKYQELKNVAILSSMTDGQLRVLEKQIALKDCVKGDIILRKGDPVVLLYVILRGMVRVVDDNNATTGIPTVTMAGPGEYFGLESLGLFGTRSTKTYIAANNVSLCGINRETFEDEELFGVVYEKLESQLRAKKITTEVRPATPPTAPALLAGAGAGAGVGGQSSASARLSNKSLRQLQQQQQQQNNDDTRSDIVQQGGADENGKKDKSPTLTDYIPIPTLDLSLW